MKPPYKKPPATPSPPHKHYYKSTTMPPINPPPPPSRPNVGEWIAKQEAEQADLQKMYDYTARLVYRRYESFMKAGFTPAAAFELTKLHTTP